MAFSSNSQTKQFTVVSKAMDNIFTLRLSSAFVSFSCATMMLSSSASFSFDAVSSFSVKSYNQTETNLSLVAVVAFHTRYYATLANKSRYLAVEAGDNGVLSTLNAHIYFPTDQNGASEWLSDWILGPYFNLIARQTSYHEVKKYSSCDVWSPWSV